MQDGDVVNRTWKIKIVNYNRNQAKILKYGIHQFVKIGLIDFYPKIPD